jgi:hypothetical protein
MKRLFLCTSIAVSMLAGCGATAPSAALTQGTASTPPPASTPTQAPQSLTGAIGGTVTYQWDGAPASTKVDAAADSATITGTAVTTFASGTHSVRLECVARDGDTWAFAGTVEKSTAEASSVGGWSAIIVKDGSPQRIGIWVSDPKAGRSDCGAWLAATGFATIDPGRFQPVESGALVPPPGGAF